MDTSTITEDANSRLIFALMSFAVLFSLIGNEIKAVKQPATGSTGVVTVAGRIILGGFFATSLLVLVSHAGEPGRKIGVGLATVATLSSVLVYGGPVWDASNKLFGSKPTTPLANPTVAAAANDTSLATGITHPTAAVAAA